jgi:hypothetical protein
VTIPTDPKEIEKLKELADRNIANGDWGDEVTMPWETTPVTPEERQGKGTVSKILSKAGGRRVPKQTKGST